jgi:hypothetical protein
MISLKDLVCYLEPALDKHNAHSGLPNQEKEKTNASEYDRGHIFYAVQEFASNCCNERVKHAYFYGLHQKLLRACLNKDKHLAGHFLSRLENNHIVKNESENLLSRHTLESIINPSVAYYYYTVGNDPAKAASYLTASLENIDYLIEAGFKDGMYMKIEQYLNSFRVAISSGNLADAASYAKDVTVYLLSAEKEKFEFPFAEVLRSPAQLKAILEMYMNAIIFKTLGNPLLEEHVKESLLLSVFSNDPINYNTNVEHELKTALAVFSSFLVKADPEMLSEEAIASVLAAKVPSSVQYYMLTRLLENTSEELLPDNTSLFKVEEYCRKVLQLNNNQMMRLLPTKIKA